MKREEKKSRKPRAAGTGAAADTPARTAGLSGRVSTPRWTWLLPPLLAAVLYAVTLANGFVLDDSILILQDGRMGSPGAFFDLRAGELVVRYWSLLADSLLWGVNPLGFHLTNLLLHALCGLAVFAYLRALLRARPLPAGPTRFGLDWGDAAALAGGLLFVAHPMQTEAVAGVTHRKEVLATLFMVIALWRSIPEGRGARDALVVGAAMALALFAKAPAVVFFPLAALQDLWVRDRRPSVWLRRDLLFYAPSLLALAGYLVYRWAGLTGAMGGGAVYFEAYNPQAAGLPTGARLLTSAMVLGLYWRLMWIPWRPTLERHVEPAAGLSDPLPWLLILAAAAALIVAFRLGRRRPLAALGLAWLVLAPLPTLNIIPLNFLFSERYLYLPVLGVILIVTALVAATPPQPAGRRSLVAAGVGLVLLLFSPLVVARGLEWKNTSTLLEATVRDNPSSPRVAYLHAMDLRDQGRLPESLAECRRALQLEPRMADAWHLAGRNYADLGRGAEALPAFERAATLARDPSAAWLNDYAVALIRAGRAGEARPVLERALEREPDEALYLENHAQLLLINPDTREEGLTDLRALTVSHPEYAPAWVLLVEAELASGRVEAAQAAAARARTGPVDETVHLFLEARLREGRGDADGAARAYRLLLAREDLDPSIRDRVAAAARRVGTP